MYLNCSYLVLRFLYSNVGFPMNRVLFCFVLCLTGICGAAETPAVKEPAKVAAPALAPGSAAAQVAEAKKKKAETQARIKEQKKIGGVLYEQYSTALHTKRLRNEFTRAEWKTILLQKRIRIPLTAQDHYDMELFFIGE